MKINIVDHNIIVGGGQLQLVNLANELSKLTKIHVEVSISNKVFFELKSRVCDRVNVNKIGRKKAEKFHPLNDNFFKLTRKAFSDLYTGIILLHDVTKLERKLRSDIIYCMSWLSLLIIIISIKCRLINRPKQLVMNINNIKMTNKFDGLYSWLLKNCDGIIFNSKFTHDSYFGLGIDFSEKSLINYSLVYPPNYVKRSESTTSIRIGYIGRVSHRKGYSVIEKLKQEVLSDRFAGLIIKGCQELTDLEPFNNPQLPKVYLLSNGKQPWRPIVTVGAEKMIQQGLDWLAKKGRKRIAVLRVPDYASTWQWEDHFEKAGLDYRAQWIQSVGRHEPSVLQTLIPLLMDYPKNQRPDGLLIIDDNLVGHAVASVNAMGLQIGKDLDIVGHCNWPCQTPSMVPIKRIGFHAGDLLKLGLDLIDTQRRGEKPIEYQCLDPSFEEPYSLG